LRILSFDLQKPMLPQRIVYVLKVFPKLSETFVAEELAELRRRGVELRILSLLPEKPGIRHDIVASADLMALTCYAPGEFPRIVQEFRPQLLHAHFATEATEMAIELATEHELPFTFTAHGYDIHRKAPPDFGPRAMAARAVVTVSQANAHYMTQTFGVPASHIRIIPCGVDTERFRPGSVDGAKGEAPLILCVARQVAVKNLGLLLDACALLLQRGVNFRCVMVGDGPCRGELEEKRSRLGLTKIVQMPGSAEQAEVLKWWQRAAVGVLTSDNEGMPVSLMEAASCGVPVAATAVGGVPELIEDGITGLLTPPNDAEALAAALARLLEDPDLRMRLGKAARQRAEEKFSVRNEVDKLAALWSEILASEGTPTVFVRDPFNSASDPDLPSLKLALDPVEARAEFKRRLPRLSGEDGRLLLKAIRVIGHKPGRRCVVEYDVRVERPGHARETVALIGKTRVRRFGNEGYRAQERIWNAGFDSASADGISVPEPVGVLPRFRMWFQRKVPGETATRLLGAPEGIELASRIAEAIHKVHVANIPTERHHLMADELRILHECLSKVQELMPDYSKRLERLLAACDRLGARVPKPRLCGIHRDFYSAQVVVHEGRIYLIDFDLYCMGDPGLDVGNFIGHITEQSLREKGDARAWAKQERALEEKFLELAGEQCGPAVAAYSTLTLVRHIYLSTRFPSRKSFTVPLLELCEERLGLA
jgi:glycosyltransferase involved in cell wall biosynthesis